MDCIEVEGGHLLKGEVAVSGSKNASLPMLCATLLAEGRFTLNQVPALKDVGSTLALLRHLGCSTEHDAHRVTLDVPATCGTEAPYDLVRQMRASVLVLGPLVARFGRAKVSLPGGCAIGTRPIDQHLKGLELMGAKITLEQGYVACEVPRGRLQGADVPFDVVTVTGTENLLCAAALAEGRTRLINAAREPEVVAVARMLREMGARIEGEGTDTITIDGVDKLNAAPITVPPDRIEAGTYLVAGALIGDGFRITNLPAAHLGSVFEALDASNVKYELDKQAGVCTLSKCDDLRPNSLKTAPFPDFATDMQAQWLVLMSQAKGRSCVTETIFENRFMHVPELNRLGARIEVIGEEACIDGGTPLDGATVMATDLRASACLVLAGLIARGTTRVRRIYHLDRGYEDLVGKLSRAGAKIARVPDEAPVP